jgi:hypothetical protein
MSGLGVKTFTSGETLTAADVNGYFMDQVVAYYSSRTTASTFFTANPSRLFTGRIIYSEADEALYVWDGAAWVGQIAIIGDGAVSTVKLAQTSGSEAVTTATIRNSAVSTVKIEDRAVTSAKIGPVEFVEVTTSRNIALTDYGKTLKVNSSSLVEITALNNTVLALPVGTEIYVIRYGTGGVTFLQGAGATIISDTNRKSIKTQYSSASLIKTDTNEWLLTGNLAD